MQDAGNLKGPNKPSWLFDGSMQIGIPGLTYDGWVQVLGKQFLTYLEAHFIELVGQLF